MDTNQSADKRKQLLLDIAKIVIIILILVFVVSIYNSVDLNSKASVPDVVMSVYGDTVPEGAEIATELEFKDLFGLSFDEFEGVIYYKPVSNMDVTEVIIAKSDSEDTLNALKVAVEQRLEEQKNLFESYAPEQFALLKDGIVKKRGNFFFYMVSEDADAYYESFIKAI